MCLHAKGMPEPTAIFSVEAASQVYNRTNEFVYLGGKVNHNADPSIEVDRCIRNAWCSFRKYTLELYDRPSALLELKLRMLRAEILETTLYGCVTWSRRASHNDTLRQAHYRFLTRCIDWRNNNRTDHPISYLDTLIETVRESIKATSRRRWILFAGFVARMGSSTIGEGGDTTISSPGRSPKQPLPGIGLHDPLHDRQACPEFIAFHQGVGQICPVWRIRYCRSA